MASLLDCVTIRHRSEIVDFVGAILLNPRVLEVAWRLPEPLLTADGRGKYPLRRLLAHHVPEGLFDRPRQGLAVPVARWLCGPLRGWVEGLGRATARGEQLLAARLFDPQVIRLRWHQHREGIWDNSGALWPVLMFMLWWRSRGSPAADAGEAA